jgi:hypothetical protein
MRTGKNLCSRAVRVVGALCDYSLFRTIHVRSLDYALLIWK